MNIIIRFI